MDLNGLKTFCAIAASGSFSAAAEKLHITQPAVSRRIRMLEEQLQSSLFDRVGKRVLLSPAGKLLLSEAEQILNAMIDIEKRLQEHNHAVNGQLCLATSHHIGIWRLPDTLRRFSQHYPEVNLDIRFVDSLDAEVLMERGDIELAIVSLDQPFSPALNSLVLWPDPLQLVTAARDSRVPSTLAELITLPAVLPDLSTVTGQLIQSQFAKQGISLQPAMTTNYLETLKMLAASGLGWSVLPETMIDDSLTTISISEIKLQRNLGVLLHRQRSRSAAAEAFLGELGLGHDVQLQIPI